MRELSTVRGATDTPEPVRALELVRLMELQNQLHIEVQRQSEAYLAHFVKALNLDDIGGKAMLLGGIHCAIESKINLLRHANSGYF
jgi:hypothetical protein